MIAGIWPQSIPAERATRVWQEGERHYYHYRLANENSGQMFEVLIEGKRIMNIHMLKAVFALKQ
jgi:hypothetical protein